jgi:hypothetical protein
MRLSASPTWLACALAVCACEPGRDARHTPASTADSVQSQVRTQQPTDTTASQWQVRRGPSGPITLETSEAELRQRHGGSVVSSTRVQIGEGETEPGTVLYPNDSLRRAEVLWQDTTARRRPARVILRGSRSRWQMPRGISLGTSLQELERLNGRPFTLAGFGWDYAGVVTDWRGGALDTALAGIKLYLDPGPAQYQSAPYSQVLGDRDYSSSLPAMQQLNPRVAQIFIDFEGP